MFKLARLDDGNYLLKHSGEYDEYHMLISESEVIQLKEELCGMGF